MTMRQRRTVAQNRAKRSIQTTQFNTTIVGKKEFTRISPKYLHGERRGKSHRMGGGVTKGQSKEGRGWPAAEHRQLRCHLGS